MKNGGLFKELGCGANFVSNMRSTLRPQIKGRLKNILEEFFWHQVQDLDLDELCFQMDESTCFTGLE